MTCYAFFNGHFLSYPPSKRITHHEEEIGKFDGFAVVYYMGYYCKRSERFDRFEWGRVLKLYYYTQDHVSLENTTKNNNSDSKFINIFTYRYLHYNIYTSYKRVAYIGTLIL